MRAAAANLVSFCVIALLRLHALNLAAFRMKPTRLSQPTRRCWIPA